MFESQPTPTLAEQIAGLEGLINKLNPINRELTRMQCEGITADILALQAIRDTLAASGWRPIETAPRNYEWIIIADFDDNGHPNCIAGSRWESSFWQYWAVRQPPTHWMPLPAAPNRGEVE